MKTGILTLIVVFITLNTIFAQDWQTNFEKAKDIATKENKPIVLVFQGSDWCAPCIKLDREIWSTDAFKSYAKNNYVMLQADFPRKKKHALTELQTKANTKLAETYNKNGIFPFVVVLDNHGKVLGQTSYKKTTPTSYIEELNSFIK
ncbi:thioredoxin family protein [Flavivirga rizhaonensis]|uniref:Thioredoxin family protein n=1 Tax=Flavivirga rizhaonensis TaxID=2559571 RepID=A0A4S1DT58_9FLAO|nr:thioredoxin family protein [Flavivirga rizhaonensis]TGV01109.1 thioredoxin family protein [Flavivirga rizhaonensis]